MVVVELAEKVGVRELTGFEKSEFFDTITVQEFTVIELAAPCLTSILDTFSLILVLE
jgi:hypothetical protein